MNTLYPYSTASKSVVLERNISQLKINILNSRCLFKQHYKCKAHKEPSHAQIRILLAIVLFCNELKYIDLIKKRHAGARLCCLVKTRVRFSLVSTDSGRKACVKPLPFHISLSLSSDGSLSERYPAGDGEDVGDIGRIYRWSFAQVSRPS